MSIAPTAPRNQPGVMGKALSLPRALCGVSDHSFSAYFLFLLAQKKKQKKGAPSLEEQAILQEALPANHLVNTVF